MQARRNISEGLELLCERLELWNRCSPSSFEADGLVRATCTRLGQESVGASEVEMPGNGRRHGEAGYSGGLCCCGAVRRIFQCERLPGIGVKGLCRPGERQRGSGSGHVLPAQFMIENRWSSLRPEVSFDPRGRGSFGGQAQVSFDG